MKSKVLILWKRYSYLIMLSILLVGLIHPMIAIIFIICMMGPAATGSFTGRFWCGSICPIGNFFDNLSIKISRKSKPPVIFKSIYVKVIVAVIMMSMFVNDMKSALGNGNQVGFIYLRMIIEAVIIGTLLSLLYNHRIWCHFCPMGSMGALVAKFRKSKKVLEVSFKCTSCRKCYTNCHMGVSPANFKESKITSSDCIQCGRCMDICPQNAIFYEKFKINNNLTLKYNASVDRANSMRLAKSYEEKLVISLLFTIPLILLSFDMVSYHFLSTAASYEKLVILDLILVSIVMLTCIDFFQLSLVSLIKGRPNIYSVITIGILSWYVYQILVVYLIITVNTLFIHNLSFLFIAITVIIVNFVRYLKYTDNLKLFKSIK